MEPCPGSARYLRSSDPTQRFLGSGGACLSVEKWWDTIHHSWVAVKHLDGRSKLVEPELQVLRHIADQAIPRAVATIDEQRDGPNDIFVVMELVQGMTLQEYCQEFVKQGQLAASEDRMLPVAAQLFDTLQALHERAHVAHMDLTSVNVMICHDAVGDWGNLRMVDFGYSRPCNAGEKDVVPKGLTAEYAAPEVLNAVVHKFSKDRRQHALVDGPAADIFSAGIVLFQMLTGCVPFSTSNIDISKIKVRKEVPAKAREQWQMAAAMLQVHTFWARALRQQVYGDAVQHPILENIRRCSSTPDEAIDFFTRTLHVAKHMRPTAAQALEHPYIRRCAGEMRAYLESQAAIIQNSPVAKQEAHAKPGKHKLFGRVGGAVREQGGRLARSAGHVLKSLPLFRGRRPSADNIHTACSSRTSSSDSSSSSKPPLSAHFFAYKHEAEQHSPRQAHKQASAGEAELCIEHAPESPTCQQPRAFAPPCDKVCSGAVSVQAWSSQQPAGTGKQAEADASEVPQVCARQVLMPVGQVGQPGHPKQSDPAQKQQACSALSAVPDVTMPRQPALKQFPAECGTVEQGAPVPSPSRPKRHGWIKKLAVAGAVVSVGCLLYSSRS